MFARVAIGSHTFTHTNTHRAIGKSPNTESVGDEHAIIDGGVRKEKWRHGPENILLSSFVGPSVSLMVEQNIIIIIMAQKKSICISVVVQRSLGVITRTSSSQKKEIDKQKRASWEVNNTIFATVYKHAKLVQRYLTHMWNLAVSFIIIHSDFLMGINFETHYREMFFPTHLTISLEI